MTYDRRRFSWPIASQDMTKLQPFIEYLKERVRKEAYSTATKLECNLVRTTAVLAVDQMLQYVHLRPMIYALAEARIAK